MSDCPAFRRRPAERRQEILEAAMKIFAERGFEKTRIVDIARRAGVSHGTVGLYFPTKEALLRACIEQMAEPQMDEVIGMIEAFEGSTEALLAALGTYWWTHLQEEDIQPIIRVVESEVGNFPELAETFRTRVHDPVLGLFLRIIARGVARGEFSCNEPQAYAQFCFGSLSHVMDWNDNMGRVLDRRIDAAKYIAIWARSVARGLS